MADLQTHGLVQRTWTFKFFARALGDDRHIRRGTYEFRIGTAPVDILRALVQGDVLSVRVTIPEGYSSWQIARAFRPAGVDSAAMLGGHPGSGTPRGAARTRRIARGVSVSRYLSGSVREYRP